MKSGMTSVVFMGVAGCGKSSAASAVARRLGWGLVEGDDFHSPASQDKMRHGVALTDADRAGWLDALGDQLALHDERGEPVALTCSALKRRYRDQLRQRSPGLRFIYLEISHADSMARVAARAAQHLFPASLVDSQFATLESPRGEAGVLCVNALHNREALADEITAWVRAEPQTV